MVEEGREEISLEQLAELQKRDPSHKIDIQVKGVAVIRDKDGNIKSTMEIVSFEDKFEDKEEVTDANH